MSINPINQFEELTTETLEQEETRQRFKITDLASLAWTFRRIKAEQKKRAELQAYATAEITRIQLWLQAETKPLDQTINFFQGLITEYAQEQKQADPDFKKQTTPYGGIGFKKQQNKWEWQDDKLLAQQFIPDNELEKLYELAAELETKSDGLVRLKISLEPEKNAIKKFTLIPAVNEQGEPIEGQFKVISPDGILLPGIVVKEQGEKLDIKIG